MKKLLDNSLSEKKRKILNWLSTGEFNERHEELRKTRAENSGKWFLESNEFISWLDGNGPSCPASVSTLIGFSDFQLVRENPFSCVFPFQSSCLIAH